MDQSFEDFLRADQQPAPAPTSGMAFEDFLRADRAMTQSQAAGAVIGAAGTNPDQEAKAVQVGKQLGLPAAVVRTDLPQHEQDAALQRNVALLRNNPALAEWVAANPERTKLAHDDFGSLANIETAITRWGMSLGTLAPMTSTPGHDLLKAAFPAFENAWSAGMDEGAQQNVQGFAAYDSRGKVHPPEAHRTDYGNLLYNATNWIASNIGGVYDLGARAVPWAISGASSGAAIGAIGGPLAPISSAAGAVAGFGSGFLGKFFSDNFKIGAGEVMAAHDQSRSREGLEVDPTVAQASAVVGGLLYAGFNSFGLGHFSSAAAASAAKLFARDAVTEAVTKPTVQAAIAKTAGTLTRTGLEGGALGVLVESSKIAGEQLGRMLSSGDFATILNDPEQRSQALDRVVQSAEQMALLAGAFHAVPMVSTFAADLLHARQAHIDAGNLQAVVDGTTDSKLRGRAPDAFTDFLRQQLDGTPVEHLYLPGEKVQELYQSFGFDPHALDDDPLFNFVPDMSHQLEQAVATGGDVKIPAADYVSRFAGTPVHEALKGDLRTRPDGFSLNDAARAVEHQRSLRELAVDIQRQSEQAGKQAELAQQVYRDLQDKLRAAGYGSEAANKQAALLAAHYQTRAERMEGKLGSALDAYRAANLEVRQVLPDSLHGVDGDQLNQMIAALKDPQARKVPTERAALGPSLAEFVAKRGGVHDAGGDLRAMDAHLWHRGKRGMPRLLREVSEYDPLKAHEFGQDETAHAAWEAGYFPDHAERPEIRDFQEALRTELAGKPRYADHAYSGELGWQQALGDLEQTLDRLGIDPKKASVAEIRTALAHYAQDAVGGFEQGERPSRPAIALAGDEIAPRGSDAKTARDAAVAWYRANLQGTKAETSIGPVEFTGRGRGKMKIGLSDPETARYVASIRDVLERGEYKGSRDNAKLDSKPTVLRYHRFEAEVAIGSGEPHRIAVLVEEHTNGKLFYDLYRDPPETNPAVSSTVFSGGAEGGKTTYHQTIASVGGDFNLSLSQSAAEGRARGSIVFERGRTVINLFEKRDLSTLLHESGHLFLEELVSDAAHPEAPEGVRADLAATLKWLGVEDAGQIGREQHEQFARGFETYLMEGKAPSLALGRVFETVKAWLTGIYRSLAALKAPLSPEMRSVFDRMLASDDAIRVARERQRLGALFHSAEDAGMSDRQFTKYQEVARAAKERANQALLAKTMAEVRRRRTEQWKTEEAGVREEAAREVNRRPDFQALHYLRTGTFLDGAATEGLERIKLNRADIVAAFGGNEAILKQLPRGVPPYVVESGGVHPDLVAGLFGYKTGKSMLTALRKLEREAQKIKVEQPGDKRSLRNRLIDEKTAARMAERHGDILADGSIEAEAVDAIHNDASMTQLGEELRALGRRERKPRSEAAGEPAGEPAPDPTAWPQSPVEFAREWAAERAAALRVEDATPATAAAHARDEAKAGRAVERALLKGDRAEAMRQKERQILSAALYRAAKDAVTEAEDALDTFRKLGRKLTVAGMEQPYLDRIHQLIGAFGLPLKRNLAELERGLGRETLEGFVGRKLAEGREITVDPALYQFSTAKPVGQLTIAELRALRDAIKSLAHNGREEQTILVDGKRADLKGLVEEAVNQVSQLPQREVPPEINPGTAPGLRGLAEKIGGIARACDSSLLKMEQLFDWLDHRNPNGLFNRTVFNRLKLAQHRENDRLLAVSRRLEELGKAQPEGWSKTLDERLTLPELRDPSKPGETVYRKKDLLAMALNVGNADNFKKLVVGYKWATLDDARSIDAAKSRVMAVLDRELSKPDWNFVQGVWDIFESFSPEVDALQRRLSGIGITKVEASPVTTRHGALRGGYYPVVFDPMKSPKAAHNKAGGEALFEDGYFRPGTAKGHTIARVEANDPLHLSLDIIPYKLRQVVHDLEFREAIIDADKLLSNDQVKQGITAAFGPEYTAQLRPWLQSIANDANRNDRTLAGIDNFLRQARVNATVVGIGFRVSTVLKHGGSALGMSVGELGPKWSRLACAELYGSNGTYGRTRAMILEKSGELRHRMDSIDRDVRESLRTVAGEFGYGNGAMATAQWLRAEAVHYSHYMVARADMESAYFVWLGAYRRAEQAGRTEGEAVAAADKLVRQAHGAQGIMDLAAIQRGPEALKLATMFYGFFNHNYNRLRDTGRLAGEGVDKWKAGDRAGAGKDFTLVLARSMTYLLMPALIEAMVSEGFPNDENEESWPGWAARALTAQVTGGVPVVRDIVKAELSGHNYEMTPVEHAVNSLLSFAFKDIPDQLGLTDHQPSERFLRHAIETPGYILGLPTGAPAGTAQYLWDYMDGREDPQNFLDFLRGVAFGPTPKTKH